VDVLIFHRHQGAATAGAKGADRLIQAQGWDPVDAGSVGDERGGAGHHRHHASSPVVRADHALAAGTETSGDLDREELVGAAGRVAATEICQGQGVGAAGGGRAGNLSDSGQIHAGRQQQRRESRRGGCHSTAAPLKGDGDSDVFVGQGLAIGAEVALDQTALNAGAGDRVDLHRHDLDRVGIGDSRTENAVVGLGLRQQEGVADQQCGHQFWPFGAGWAGLGVGFALAASAAGTISPDGSITYSPDLPWCSC
jgi:hypothetical protein